MKIVYISLKEIRPDFFFSFSGDRDLSPLIKSIRESGLKSPLPVIQIESRYQLIAGFSRYKSLLQREVKDIPVHLLDNSIDILDHFFAELRVHLIDHTLDLIEKSRILSIISQLKGKMDRFPDMLEIPANPGIISRIISLSELTPAVQKYISVNGLSLKQCDMFFCMNSSLQEKFMKLASDFNIRAVELGVIFRLCEDIAGKNDIDIEAVLNQESIHNLVQSELSRGQILAGLKDILTRQRYPDLSKLNKLLEQRKKNLKIPAAIQLVWDKTLEKPGLEIKAGLHSVEEAEQAGLWLKHPDTAVIIKAMLEIV